MYALLNPIDSADAKTCGINATSEIRESPNSGRRSGSLAVFDAFATHALAWIDRPGIGYLPVTASPYDAAYFAKYQEYAQTPMGRALNAARLAFVERYWQGAGVLDVGIGCGQFVESRPGTFGYDINPAGVAWLRERAVYLDPYDVPVDVACFWDSLEHIADPGAILDRVSHRVFVSLPIFRDLAHVLASKHYRPTEHCWYFTTDGFVAFMRAHGWRMLALADFETDIGREDIRSFCFARAEA